MSIEEARLYLEHTSKDDFNLEEHQKVNRYEAIQVVLQEIERLNNIIKEAREYHDNCINNLLDLDKIVDNERLAYKVAYEIHENYSKILGSDKE